MAPIIPYVPQEITVHLGSPSSYAQNVTVSFPDYIKNVAASEIYPTWEPSAIRANVLAQISFALNRVYTEFYRSRGYDFNITNSTATDQKFIYGRNTFENIDAIVDEIFNDYIRRQGFVEPLAAKFCNGTTTTCDGLSQWGSQSLAEQGLDSVQILKTYYGDDIEIVVNAPISGLRRLYPGTPLRLGDTGADVATLQTALNRVAQSYPAIPKIDPVDGVFGQSTESAVREFQRIFSLTADGIAGQATYNKLVLIYVGLTKLSELTSEGQTIFYNAYQYPDAISEGDTGEKVVFLQYFLSVLSEFIAQIPAVEVTGTFENETKIAVIAFQRYEGLPETGVVDEKTWDLIYREFVGIVDTVLKSQLDFPSQAIPPEEILPADPKARVTMLQTRLNNLAPAYPELGQVSVSGQSDGATVRAVKTLQSMSDIPATGKMDARSWQTLRDLESTQKYSKTTRLMQFPGKKLTAGMKDGEL